MTQFTPIATIPDAGVAPTPALPLPAAASPAAARTGPLRSGNPRGNPNLAPRCGAKARTTGCPCRAPAMPNGRCRLHGGKSTGPRTPKGFASLAKARTTHGKSTAAARAARRWVQTLITHSQVLTTAMDLRPYLPAAIRARLDLGADELAAPPPPVQPPDPPRQELTQCDAADRPVVPVAPAGVDPPGACGRLVARDPRGRFVTRPRPAPRGQQAERAAARIERATLAPWRAGIKRARLVRRLMLYQAQNARRAERAQTAAPSLPSGTRPADGTPRPGATTAASPSAAASRHDGTGARGTHFEDPGCNPMRCDALAHPGGPSGAAGNGADKTLMQRGTVALLAGSCGTASEVSDRTFMQRGTVTRLAGLGGAGGDSADRTLVHRGTVAQPAGAGEAAGDNTDRTRMQRLPPGTSPGGGTMVRPADAGGIAGEDVEAARADAPTAPRAPVLLRRLLPRVLVEALKAAANPNLPLPPGIGPDAGAARPGTGRLRLGCWAAPPPTRWRCAAWGRNSRPRA